MMQPEGENPDYQELQCPEEWCRVYETERPRLRRLAASYAPYLDWESAVEDAFIQSLIHWETVINPRSWLTRVTINILHDEHRKHGPPVDINDDYLRLLKGSCDVLLVGRARDAEHAHELSETIAAVCRLDPPRREAIVLRANGVPDDEIADLLGWTKRTVQQKICSALKEIAEAVGNAERRPRAKVNRDAGPTGKGSGRER
jgi:RNA polymerase sigma factor (sigma-70 family)